MLLKLSKLFLCVAVFSVTIVVVSTFFPFIGGKYYFFRSAVEAALIALLLWWAFEAPAGAMKQRVNRVIMNPVFVAVSAFALMFVLASLFANDPGGAFWSNFERGEGGFQMIHYYSFFALLTFLFDRREDWTRLFKLSLVAAVLMIFYGILAAAYPTSFIGPYRTETGGTIAPTALGSVFSHVRFQGSLGNPAYVAPYLLFSIFYAFYLWFGRPGRKTLVRHIGFGALIAFFLVFFGLSGTRGGFLGLVAGILVFFFYLVLSNARLRKFGMIGLGVVLALGALAFSFRETLIKNNVPGSRFLSISISEQTAQTRFWTWGSALEGFKERPLLGWGPENFSAVFDKHFNPNHYVPGEQTETWFDRAHSVIFDYLAETGLLGFAAYIGMFIALLLSFITLERNIRERGAPLPAGNPVLMPLAHSAVLQGLFIALPIAYLVQALILFDVLPIYLNLFIFLAFATFEFSETHGSHS